MLSGIDYRHDDILLHTSFEHLQLVAAGARGDFVHDELDRQRYLAK